MIMPAVNYQRGDRLISLYNYLMRHFIHRWSPLVTYSPEGLCMFVPLTLNSKNSFLTTLYGLLDL